jgi:Calx-beta domain.
MKIVKTGVCSAAACLLLCLCNNNPTNAPVLPTVAFSSAKQVVAENSGTVNVEVALSTASKSNVTIPVIVTDNSGAKSSLVYTPDSTAIVIPAGSLTGNVRLSLIDSIINENSKTVFLRLGAPINARPGAGIVDTTIIVNQDGFGLLYKFSDNELTGWTQDTNADAFTVWKGDSLIVSQDGGADLYLNRGCLITMYQTLDGPNGPDAQICTITAMICGTDVQADSIFKYQKENLGASVAIPQYDTTAVFAHPGVSGITVFAHFKAMYFELALSGYSDRDSSLSVATQMLKILESKTK